MYSSRRVLDVPNPCGGGEFDGCEGRIRPFLDSLSFFIARGDSASDSFRLFSISACKLFCSGPPQCSSCIHQHNSKRTQLTLSSSLSFSFSSSFFVVFVVFIPRADRGVVCMRVLEKFGGFVGFVGTGLGCSEHVRRR